MTDLVRNQPEPAAPCPHTETFRGEDSPRRWGSDRTQVCAACGMYRRTNHYNRDLSGWLPAEQQAHVKLLAATPDLYEACRAIIDAVETGDEEAAIAMARFAVTKAESK